jgi:hypothetical protein
MIQLLLALLLSLPAYYRDVETPEQRLERMTTVAQSIDAATYEATCTGPFQGADWCTNVWSGPRAELAALLVTVGYHESTFARHVGEGHCAKHECDHGRARHYWQTQVNPWVPRANWEQLEGLGFVPTTMAAGAAASVLGEGLRRCRSPEGAVSFYARSSCRWAGTERRMGLYRRALASLSPQP